MYTNMNKTKQIFNEQLEEFDKLWEISIENGKATDIKTNCKLFLKQTQTNLIKGIIEDLEGMKSLELTNKAFKNEIPDMREDMESYIDFIQKQSQEHGGNLAITDIQTYLKSIIDNK